MRVPLLDLTAQHRAIGEAVLARVTAVIESQQFVLGPLVQELEVAIAALSRAASGIAVASGTDALLLPLQALDLRPGDEVITSPFTFFASAGTIHNAGARPVFVDIEPDTFNLDVAQVEAAVTPRTRAVMPVHLFGQMVAMERLLPVARRHGLTVLEDACQSIGARRRIDGAWRMAGELGHAAGFSFFPTKNLGGWGDGGMVVSSDEALAQRVRLLRTHGGARTYFHDVVGTNSRLDAIQAAVLLAKLPFLASWSAARRAHAAGYTAALAGVDAVRTPATDPLNEHIFHQYVIAVDRRDELQEHLTAAGVGTAVYYPLPLHRQRCFAYLGYQEGALPVAEAAARRVLALPIFPELSGPQREYVVSCIRSFFGA